MIDFINYKKIMIVGSGGSGKSTLAPRIGAVAKLPVIHLDKEFWQRGWVESPREEWTERQKGFIEKEEWIIDGNYGGTMEQRFAAADLIIFLDINRFVCILSVLKRFIMNFGKTRKDMAEGCPEKIDFEFLLWIWNYPKNGKKKVIELHNKYPEKKFLQIKSRRELKNIIE